MAMKPGLWALLLLQLSGTTPANSQKSPLQWPVPPPGAPREPAVPHVLVGAAELAEMLRQDSAVALDVRPMVLYEKGHLAGAVPAWDPEEEAPGGIDRVRTLLAQRGIAGDKEVVLYGGPDRGRVARLFWLVRWSGCPQVRILEGGFESWRSAHGPLETGPSRADPAEFRPSPNGSLSVDAGWVTSSFGQAGVELLDVRDARGWDKWQTPPLFAEGHIPYSLPFDANALLPIDGGWPNPIELRRHLSRLGPRTDEPFNLESTFVLYGEDSRDPRIGLSYLLLTLAGLEVRVFPGGWQEWTAPGDRPVVQMISAAELADLLKRENPALDLDHRPRGVILLDLREPRDFAIGHLPGALSLPYYAIAETLAEILEMKIQKGWPGADRMLPLVLYCYGPECLRSREGSAQAVRLGFRKVLWFRGGIQEWRQAGYPLFDSAFPTDRPTSPGGGAGHP